MGTITKVVVMMKISIVRKDKKGNKHLTIKSIEWFLQRIKIDTKAEDIGKFRQHVARFGDTNLYEVSVPVAMIYPLVEMVKTENDNLEIKAFNSLTWLHVGNLMKPEEVNTVKEASKILPTTFAAFTGADGRSVEILVSVVQKDTTAKFQTEADMDAFCTSAYEVAFGAYSGVLPSPIERQTVKARCCFRMTLDDEPYYNPQVTPMMVQTHRSFTKPSDKTDSEQREKDYRLYEDYELLYKQAAHEAFEETCNMKESEQYDAYITLLAHKLCDVNFPEEETFVHIRNHHVYRKIYNDARFRSIVSAVYSEEKPKHRKEGEMVSVEMRRLIEFLTTRYVFRYNEVMGYTEYRPNTTWLQDWAPCDENVINGMTIEARLANLDVKDKDVRRYVHSNMIRKVNPISDFLSNCYDKWDGKTDHIAMLARCVPCQIPQWETWFKKWFLYMVAQWMMPQQEYGNSVVPLLISPQGDGKTTFYRMILPKQLRWGFLENLDVSEKRSTLQAMHNFLLINLDEFNSISAKLQEGFLKNVIQLPNVKIKRPYGKHVEEFKRYASFIATTNESNVLSDPSGSRRFICISLTAPINTDYKPNYEALYGQAYKMIINREIDWWFNADEVKEIMAHNRQYQLTPPAVHYFNEYYQPAMDETDGKWLSPTCHL
jgi:Predicted P-loop ATPase and inactivated derivatives